jgi:hypothetical protein
VRTITRRQWVGWAAVCILIVGFSKNKKKVK